MDFLNKTYAQLTELFRSMTPAARITSAMLLVVIVISLGYLVTFQISGGEEYLFSGYEFSDRELQEMGVIFSRAGLKDWDIVGNRMRVPRSRHADYVATLAAENALPDDMDTVMDALFEDGSIFESRQTKELRYKLAMQKRLGITISAIPGIERATVQVDEISRGGFPPKTEMTAVVAVKATGRKSLDESLIETIRDTTISGIAGLELKNVTVTDLNAGRAYTGSSQGGQFGLPDNIYAANKKLFEKVWKDKLYERLAMYPGVVVGVNVELNPEINHASSKITYDPQPTAVESSSMTKTNDSGPAPGGRPGTDPNLVVGNAPRSVSTTQDKQSSSEELREEQKSVAGHEQVTMQKAPLVPNRVTASIGIPKSYLVKVWKKENPPAAGQQPVEPDAASLQKVETRELTEIEEAVNAILPPVEAGDNPYPRVKVTTYEDFEEPGIEEPSAASTALYWLSTNWQTIGMFVVGLFSLLMLRSMVRSAAMSGESASTAELASAAMEGLDTEREDGGSSDEEEPVTNILGKRLRSSGPNLRDELSAMVREDPDAAANVLRNWIGDAA